MMASSKVTHNMTAFPERKDHDRISDIETMIVGDYAQLTNTSVRILGWKDVSVTVKDRQTQQPKTLFPIEMTSSSLASSSRLWDLLVPANVHFLLYWHRGLRHRMQMSGLQSTSTELSPTQKSFCRIIAYVEQDDALIGSLIVWENNFAATFTSQPRKGSSGQKRCVSVAKQVITSPKLPLLDKPTLGLGSAASFEFIPFMKNIAKKQNLTFIASIHQPSTSACAIFDKLLLLSQGGTAYSGVGAEVQPYFDACGFPIPLYINPAELIIDFVNTDFARDRSDGRQPLNMIHYSWHRSRPATAIVAELLTDEMARKPMDTEINVEPKGETRSTRHARRTAVYGTVLCKRQRKS
ncbi:hypothetical protein KC316_g5943 [Hortaea werneckii]|nr:hypothetical protein KC316_g5943 [Hortaea werneckii]